MSPSPPSSSALGVLGGVADASGRGGNTVGIRAAGGVVGAVVVGAVVVGGTTGTGAVEAGAVGAGAVGTGAASAGKTVGSLGLPSGLSSSKSEMVSPSLSSLDVDRATTAS